MPLIRCSDQGSKTLEEFYTWYVSIVSSGPDNCYVDYLMPEDKQLWPDSRVKGEADSYEELMKYIVIAMTESGGWPDNAELKELYAQIK
jgi:hypothetical protein